MKELKIPFTFYDFFGYFLPGLIAIAIIIIFLSPSHDAEGLKPVIDTISKIGILLSLFVIFLCYSIGHLMATLSSLILEKLILSRLFSHKMPEKRLFPSTPKEKQLFSERFTEKFKEAVETYFKIKVDRIKKSEIFWLCNTVIVNECPNIYARVFVFLSFYGFARTMSLIFGFSAPLFTIRLILNWPEPSSFYIVVASAILCAVFFHEYLRFLKYHRQDIFYGFYNYVVGKSLESTEEVTTSTSG